LGRILNALSKYSTWPVFVGGVVAGALVCLGALRLSGVVFLSQGERNEQLQQIAELKAENRELTNDLFRYQAPQAGPGDLELPFQPDADASGAVAAGRAEARANEQILMITFGANWCLDCRTLYRHLQDDEVRAYTTGLFRFVNVDVGLFNKNRELAAELGVDLGRGIPVAVFFGPEGELVGTTNDGQLEPARYYTSKQILKFVRDVAEKSMITAPDSIR
jgi:protein disulfide-isomerase